MREKLSDEMDMALFHVEQDVRDLEEEVIEGKMSRGAISSKLLDIAEKLGDLQNDGLCDGEVDGDGTVTVGGQDNQGH